MTGTDPAADEPPTARFAVLSLLGAWLDTVGPTWPLAALLRLLEPCGVSEAAARAQVQRMAADGWFDVERCGRHSSYHLTPSALAELAAGDVRVLETPSPPWDSTWTLVLYEVPDARRSARDRLRLQLQWLGFGCLKSGSWISPHDRAAEVIAVAERLGVVDAIDVVHPATVAMPAPDAVVARCWDLAAIGARHAALAESAAAIGRVRTDEEAFARDLHLLMGQLRILRDDPNLPADLLPRAWTGTAARRAVARRRDRLRAPAARHVRTVTARTSDRADPVG